MTRREKLLALAGVGLLAAGGWLAASHRPPTRELRLEAGGCRFPLTVLGGQRGEQSVAAVVFHGFSGNRRVMTLLGRALATPELAVYLVDFPGHGDSTESFDYARGARCALDLLVELERRGEIRADRTVLMGHSMGAGMAIRVADFFPAAATISISASLRMPPAERPGPIITLDKPHRMPSNLLILAGQLDLPPARTMSAELFAAGGGQRTAPEDFRQRRAVSQITFPGATHTSVLFDSRVSAASAYWVARVFPEIAPPGPSHRALVGGLFGLAGLLALFPASAALVTSAPRKHLAPEPEARHERLAARKLIGLWIAAGLLAVAAQARGVLLEGLVPSFGGDYLASLALLAGALLLAAQWLAPRAPADANIVPRGANLRGWLTDARGMAAGAALAVLVMLGFGFWLDWQFTEAWPNSPRWLLFATLLPGFLIYHLAEEAALGPPPAAPSAAVRRLALFLGMRGGMLLAIVGAFFAFDSGEILPVLLGSYLALNSLLFRLGADSVRGRTASPAGAAVFATILAAWFVAAVFPFQ